MVPRQLLCLSVVSTLLGCAVAAPKVDVVAEERSIRQLTTDWFAAEKNRDMEKSISYLTPDAVIQPEGAPTIVGHEGMRALYKELFALPYTDLVMEPRTVVVAPSGDLAYDVGPWKVVTVTKSGKAEAAGKSTIVWKKVNGQWKAAVMAFSMDAPAAPSSPAARPSKK